VLTRVVQVIITVQTLL